MHRVVLAVVVSLVLAACSPGLAANPRYATDSGAGPQGAPQTSDQPAGPPAIEAPVRVAAASRRTVGPFDRLLMSERPLTANEVRKMFKLTARHGRNPR